jgi:hypothetical protein
MTSTQLPINEQTCEKLDRLPPRQQAIVAQLVDAFLSMQVPQEDRPEPPQPTFQSFRPAIHLRLAMHIADSLAQSEFLDLDARSWEEVYPAAIAAIAQVLKDTIYDFNFECELEDYKLGLVGK